MNAKHEYNQLRRKYLALIRRAQKGDSTLYDLSDDRFPGCVFLGKEIQEAYSKMSVAYNAMKAAEK